MRFPQFGHRPAAIIFAFQRSCRSHFSFMSGTIHNAENVSSKIMHFFLAVDQQMRIVATWRENKVPET